MTYDEFRKEMYAFQRSATADGERNHDPTISIELIDRLYLKFDAGERAMADRVVAEWALSGDKYLEYDALHLISEFAIDAAVPALRELAKRQWFKRTPVADAMRERLERMIAALSAQSRSAPGQG